jgi:hypothetical protein
MPEKHSLKFGKNAEEIANGGVIGDLEREIYRLEALS